MGTFTAYGFSRFKVKGEGDLLFFILSTRMLPPVVVAIPMAGAVVTVRGQPLFARRGPG